MAEAKKKKVFILYGQGGYVLSAGMYNFGETLPKSEFDVTYWKYSDHRHVALAMMSFLREKNPPKVSGVGFSLGANALSWIASDANLKGLVADLMVAYDPSVLAPTHPIPKTVKRCIVHRQMGYAITSLAYGRATFSTSPAGGPKIEENRFYADHLAVPYLSSLHAKTRKALELM